VRTTWKVGALKEYSIQVSTGPFGSMLHKSDYAASGVPLINPTNIIEDGIVPDSNKQLSGEALKRLSNYVLKSGDVLVGRRGEVGRCAVIGPQEAGWVCGTGCFFIRPSPSLLNSTFLAQLLRSPMYRSLLERASTGATMKNISNDTLATLEIAVPSLYEQTRIVTILDEAFEDIATAKANAQKNLQNARAIFESQLQFVFTERGRTWKQKTLEEIATTFGRGKSKHRPRNAPHLYGGDYPFVQTGDIRNADHIITEYSQTYSEEGLAQSKLWPKGTICITIAANIAETAILGFEACFPDSVIGVVANPREADVGFIEYLLQSFKVRIQAMGKGSAQANINMGTFENERFPFPSVTEQQSIVTELDGLNLTTQRLTAIYARKLAALDALKKSLLHRAFAGELTASMPSELIEAVA
jgi:type I restriction enzyme, S subunit